MNWDRVVEVWDEFLRFMDRVVQWLQFVFNAEPDEGWDPEDYPDINA